jgi:hypothetical protein
MMLRSDQPTARCHHSTAFIAVPASSISAPMSDARVEIAGWM